MRIDGITVNLYDDDSGDDYEIHLGYDSGDDIYPNIELSDKIQQQILEIRKVVFG